jgi:hypothetical protein
MNTLLAFISRIRDLAILNQVLNTLLEMSITY